MANNPKHQAVLRKVERALKSAGAIIVAVRLEGDRVHCDLDVQTFPNDDVDIATDLIIAALDNHKARLAQPQPPPGNRPIATEAAQAQQEMAAP
jgi:hypothetical protein